jgi:hypothetical protein
VENFGWPCYEGTPTQPEYDATNLTICENLYSEGSAVPPYYRYHHSLPVVPGDGCPLGFGSVISAMAFYRTGNYPSILRGALFFGDHSRNCIWVMLKGANGEPDPSKLHLFRGGAHFPVNLEVGPGGNLFYVDFDEGQVRGFQFSG